MSNVLELEEFEIVQEFKNVEYMTKKYVVKAKDEPLLCTKCGSTVGLDGTIDGQKFKRFDMRTRQVKDIELRGYKVVLEVQQRRFTCPACKLKFPEFFESIAPDDKITKRLFTHIGKESLKENFLKVAEKHGISVDTVKRSFFQQVAEFDRNRTLIAPRILGIDEIYIKEEGIKRKQPYAVFTDIENRRIIEFVKGNTKERVIEIIKSMEGYKEVEVVTMDMATSYRFAVDECCPKAFCVVDHFHVMQKFGMALNTIRADIQTNLKKGDKELGSKELFAIKGLIGANKEDLSEELILKLQTVLDKHPRLKVAYECKELLREVYKCESKYDAYQKYYEWECSIPKGKPYKEIQGIQRMINKLKKEVFAYFDGGWTNAYTECTNSLIRRIIRDGNGYGFETLRAKILYGTTASKVKTIKIKDMNFYEMFNSMEKTGYMTFIQPMYREVLYYYTDIDELIDIMDKGNF